jgi:transforming growth factor-beta-induced protein
MQAKKVLLILLTALLLVGATMTTGYNTVAAAPVLQTDGEEPDTTEATETDETQAETTPTLMEVIAADAQLSDLETLVEATGLADNLTKDGPFTVLAPTNAALATLDAVTANNNATITDILLYHIINGQYSHADLANVSTIPTLFGEHVAFNVEGGEVMLNDSVSFITTDIEAENGVVHIVDTLLVPPENSLITSNKGSWSKTVDEVLAADGRFTTFLALAEAAGLRESLADLGQTYTVFVPTDAAYEQLPEALLADMWADPETFVSYLLVNDQLGVNQIATATYIPTIEGRPLFVTTNEALQVQLNGQPLTEFNIVAANGVMHVVETVPVP